MKWRRPTGRGRGPGNVNGTRVPDGWIVSPTGSSSNAGTYGSPWSLAFAITGASGAIDPGDTVWLRGGTYNDPAALTVENVRMYDVTVDGTDGNPITFRSYPGEWAIIDDHRANATTTGEMYALWISGTDVVVRDIEVVCSSTIRETASAITTMLRGGVVAAVGARSEVVNVVVHDGAQGVIAMISNPYCELTGVIIYNTGGRTGSSAFGHNVYTQTISPDAKLFRDCLFLAGYSYNLHIYTGGSSFELYGYTVEDCTSLDGGILNGGSLTQFATPGSGDLWGGSSSGKPLTHSTIDGYWSDGGLVISDLTLKPHHLRIRRCFYLGCRDGRGVISLRGVEDILEFKNNTVWNRNSIDSPPAVEYRPTDDEFITTFSPASPSDIDGNAYYLKDSNHWPIKNTANVFKTLAQWRADTGYDLTSTADDDGSGPADFADVVVNPAETGRATVRIFKASGSTSLAVDLSSVLDDGQGYWLYDGRNPLDGAFASGTYDGDPVTITFADMPGRAIPVGWPATPIIGNEATHPVVIVRRVGPDWVAPPEALAV